MKLKYLLIFILIHSFYICLFWPVDNFASIISNKKEDTIENENFGLDNKNSDFVIKLKSFTEIQKQFESNQSKWDFLWSKIPSDQIYKFYIDKRDHGGGKFAYDLGRCHTGHKEPGYAEGMEAAFELIRNHIGKKNDFNFFIKLHDTAVNNVKRNNCGTEENIPSGVSHFLPEYDKMWGYPVNLGKVSKKAKIEWEEEKLILDKYATEESRTFINEEGRRVSKAPFQLKIDETDYQKEYLSTFNWACNHFVISNLPSKIKLDPESHNNPLKIPLAQYETLLTKYEKELVTAEKDKDNFKKYTYLKLSAIARFARALEISHFFRDGNQRTIVMGLLNKLLIEDNFPLVILEDNYIFDGYKSTHEIVEELYQGFLNYFEIITIKN